MKEASASILTSDRIMAKDLSEIFRQMGVVAEYFENLEEAWFGVLQDEPSVLLVDLRCIWQDQRFLGEHPGVRDGDLSLIFIYQENQRPLLQSVWDLPSLGEILWHEEDHSQARRHFLGHLKLALKRANLQEHNLLRERELRLKIDSLEKELDKTSERLLQEQQKEETFLSHLKFHRSLMELRKTKPLLSALVESLENFDPLEQYALLTLDSQGLQLRSVRETGAKGRSLAPIALLERSLSGVGTDGQIFVKQAAYELFGSEGHVLALNKHFGRPKAFLIMKAKQHIDLQWPEMMIDFHFLSEELRNLQGGGASGPIRWMESFDFLTQVDQLGQSSSIRPSSLIVVNFQALFHQVKAQAGGEFLWGDFWKEWRGKIEGQFPFEASGSLLSPHIVAFTVATHQEQESFLLLRRLCQSFSYEHFFQRPEEVMAKDLRPHLEQRPLSAKQAISMEMATHFLGPEVGDKNLPSLNTMIDLMPKDHRKGLDEFS